MDWVVVIGALSLGLVLGWMSYVVFQGRRDVVTLTGIVGVIGGTVVLGIFRAFSSRPEATLPREVSFYLIGILVGIGISPAIAKYDHYKKLRKARDDIIDYIESIKPHMMVGLDRLKDRFSLEPQFVNEVLAKCPQKGNKKLVHKQLAPKVPGDPQRPGVGLTYL